MCYLISKDLFVVGVFESSMTSFGNDGGQAEALKHYTISDFLQASYLIARIV